MDSVKLTNSAIDRVCEIKKNPANNNKFLRIAVLSGGCNGFQYTFELDDKLDKENDIVLSKQDSQALAVIDETSASFLNGAEVDFIKELGASYFKIKNPNATASCGCGSSFSI